MREFIIKNQRAIILSALNATTLCLIVIFPFNNYINSSQIDPNIFSAIHYKYNSYFLLSSLGAFFASDFGIRALLLIGISCSYLILTKLYDDSLKTLLANLTAWFVLLQIFQLDFIILSVLSLSAAFFLVILSVKTFNSSSIVLLIFFCITAWLCLFNLAILSLILAMLLILVLGSHFKASVSENFSINSKILIWFCFLSLLLANTFSMALPWPDYPNDSKLTVLFDAPGWHARPLIGSDNQIRVLDRLSVRTALQYPLLITFAIYLLLQFFFRKSTHNLLLAASLILLFFDLRLPESYSQIMPIQAFSRLIPGISEIALSSIILACIIFSLTFHIVINFRSVMFVFLGLSAVFFVDTPENQTNCPNQFKATPSCSAARHFAAEIISSDKNESFLFRQQKFKSRRLAKRDFQIRTSESGLDSNFMFDKDPATRWSPNTGKQNAQEWIELAFYEKQQSAGIHLELGNFLTDFPRGLEVLAGETCDLPNLKLLYRTQNWQGPLTLTEKGYPYFSDQSDVRIFFNSSVEFACLLIRQIGRTEHYDWSVAELELLKADQGNASLLKESE